MKRLARILAALVALVAAIGWTVFTIKLWKWGSSYSLGGGDGSGTASSSGVEELLSPPTQTKAERAKEALALLNNENVVLYGKVTDQFDAPVAGAEISGSIQVNDGTRVGVDQIRLVTDNNGMFTISGYTGKALGIAVKKPGYVMATTNTRFVFSHIWSEAEQHHPDPSIPTIIKMWKLQGAEPLVSIDQHYRISFTVIPQE